MKTDNQICRSSDTSGTSAPEGVERYKPIYTSEYNEESWLVKVALPGVEKSEIEVSIDDEILEIKGLRKADVPESWTRLSGVDRDRSYELKLDVGPEVDGTKIEATQRNGELLINLPLKEESKPISITVN